MNDNKYISTVISGPYREFAQYIDKESVNKDFNLDYMVLHTGKLAERIVSSKLAGAKISLCDKIKDFFGKIFSDDYCQAKELVAQILTDFKWRYKESHQLNPNKEDTVALLAKKLLGERCEEAQKAGEVINKEKVAGFKKEIEENLKQIPEEEKEKLIQDLNQSKELASEQPEEYDINNYRYFHLSLIDGEKIAYTGKGIMGKIERRQHRKEEAAAKVLEEKIRVEEENKRVALELQQQKELEAKLPPVEEKKLTPEEQLQKEIEEKAKNDVAKAKDQFEMAKQLEEDAKKKMVETLGKLKELNYPEVVQNLPTILETSKKDQLTASMMESIKSIEEMQLIIKKQEAFASQNPGDKEIKAATDEGIKNTQAEIAKLNEKLEVIKQELSKK